jgi:SAM-dependent methyltransferase
MDFLAEDGHTDPAEYGERIGGRYDEWYGSRDDPAPIADFLAARVGSGPALELGIGTGRIALPLAERGVTVDGIDASPRMVGQLHGKPGGADIAVSIGDFADVSAPGGSYGLIYVVFNTFLMLLTQEDQVRCFANVAAHLVPGGAFVMEAFIPNLAGFDENQRVRADQFDQASTRLTASLLDRAGQRIRARHFVIGAAGIETYPIELRYAWPSEIDLMARLAGLRLTGRWGGWQGQPFTSRSDSHVSVWQAPDPA